MAAPALALSAILLAVFVSDAPSSPLHVSSCSLCGISHLKNGLWSERSRPVKVTHRSMRVLAGSTAAAPVCSCAYKLRGGAGDDVDDANPPTVHYHQMGKGGPREAGDGRDDLSSYVPAMMQQLSVRDPSCKTLRSSS